MVASHGPPPVASKNIGDRAAAQLGQFFSGVQEVQAPVLQTGSFPKLGGHQHRYRAQNTIVLVIGTPKKGSANFGRPPTGTAHLGPVHVPAASRALHGKHCV